MSIAQMRREAFKPSLRSLKINAVLRHAGVELKFEQNTRTGKKMKIEKVDQIKHNQAF
jgi:hypothetical protein